MSDRTPSSSGNDAPATTAAPASAARTVDKPRNPFLPKGYSPELNRGYSTANGRGFELAATVLAMVGLGILADRVFDTAPLFVIIFTLIGFAGTTVKLWLGYDLEMKGHEAGAIWNRKAGSDS